MTKCRVFLKNSSHRLAKVYEIRQVKLKNELSVQAQLWSAILCKELGLPLDSEIHYTYLSTGKDSHLTVNYNDYGPFNNQEIEKVVHRLKIPFGSNEYKHKQEIQKKNTSSKTITTNYFPIMDDNKLKYITPGYIPPSFPEYQENRKVFHFGTISLPLLDSKRNGDPSRTPLSDNDIVIDEFDSKNDRINICGFLCNKDYYIPRSDPKHQVRIIKHPLFDFGLSLIFS